MGFIQDPETTYPRSRGKNKSTGFRQQCKEVFLWEILRITLGFYFSRTGAKKRAFHSESPPVWPVFKWAHDDKFFARMTQVKRRPDIFSVFYFVILRKSLRVLMRQIIHLFLLFKIHFMINCQFFVR
jgi:hypothetical protein